MDKYKITFDETKVNSDLNNFPVKIKLDSQFAGWSEISQDNVYFTDENENILDHEIEFYNQGSEAIYNVKIPTLSSTVSTEIYLNYDGSGYSNGNNSTDVWSGYEYVFHMQDTNMSDSSSNNIASLRSSLTSDTGLNGNSIYFAGDDFALLNHFYDTTSMPSFTVYAVSKIPSNGGGWSLLDYDRSEYFTATTGLPNGDNNGSGGDRAGFHTTNGSTDDFWSNDINANDNNWKHYAFKYDGSTKYIYVNGNLEGTRSESGIGTSLRRYGTIGDGSEADSYSTSSDERNQIYFLGNIDEIRLIETDHSEDWIQADYHSMFNNLIKSIEFIEFIQPNLKNIFNGTSQIDKIYYGQPSPTTFSKWFEDDLTLTRTYNVSGDIGNNAETERQNNAVFATDIIFPTTPSNGNIFEMGGAALGGYVGFRDNGATLRLRTGDGDTKTSSTSDTAVLDLTSFPQDGEVHNLMWEFRINPGRVRAFIDGELVGEANTTSGGALDENVWAGTDEGVFLSNSSGSNTSFQTGESDVDYPEKTGNETLRFYANQLLPENGEQVTENIPPTISRVYLGDSLVYGEPPLSFPTYVQGVDRSVNGPTYLFFAREGNNSPGGCNSGRPNAYAFFDLRGIAVNSIDFVFDFRYFNSQPKIGTRSAAPTTTITFDGAKNQWSITDLTDVDIENLFDTYGGSGSDTDVSRSYTYNGRTDLILQIGVNSCQANNDRFVGIKSLTINGINITQFANNNNQTTVSA